MLNPFLFANSADLDQLETKRYLADQDLHCFQSMIMNEILQLDSRPGNEMLFRVKSAEPGIKSDENIAL